MTTYCPECGEAGQEESAVLPLVPMWSRCEQCQYVWRSSILDTVTTYAKRRIGLARYQKSEQRYETSALMDTSALSTPDVLEPVDADRVAQWLVSQEKATPGPKVAPVMPQAPPAPLAPVAHQHREPASVEDFFDQLDAVSVPVRAESKIEPQEDFYSFFSEKPVVVEEALTEEWLSEEESPEASEAMESLAGDRFVAEAPRSAGTPLEASVDRALTNVEDLYDAFKRLEQQLGGMEKMCEELVQSR